MDLAPGSGLKSSPCHCQTLPNTSWAPLAAAAGIRATGSRGELAVPADLAAEAAPSSGGGVGAAHAASRRALCSASVGRRQGWPSRALRQAQ
jgi:hypothetical protein